MMRQPPRGGRRPEGAKEPQPAPTPALPVPHQAAQAFQAQWQGSGALNASLIFDRYAPDWAGKGEVKKDGLAIVEKAAGRVDQKALAAAQTRWRRLVEAVHAQPFTLRTDWRLIAGLGRKGPLEVGFTFHGYGFPILPGSSVKGVARAWTFCELAERLQESDLHRLEEILALPEQGKYEEQFTDRYRQPKPEVVAMAADFRAIFGTTGAAGLAIFFDAIPAGQPKLQLDIMNPHFPGYYGDKKGDVPPTDWQSPKPVYFLTVAPKTEFLFAVGWRQPLAGDAGAARRQSRAQEWLIRGLTDLGIGAKTSAGYGYFQPQSTPLPDRAPGAPSSAPSSVGPVPPAGPLQARRGTIVEIRPDKRYGKVRDVETGHEYRFPIEAIQGDTPGKKSSVAFDLQGDQVVRVRKG